MGDIDINEIANELDFTIDDVRMLIGIFLDTAQDSLNNLETSIRENNFEEIAQFAHSIKGSSANLRLKEISELAKTIELKAKNKSTFNYMKYYTNLKEKINQVKTDKSFT